MTFVKRTLQQRIIALAAAYAIALASLIASFGAAQAAAEAATRSDPVICHSSAERPAPTSDESNGKICVDCCIGCVTAVPSAVPPATSVVIIRQVSITRLEPLAPRVLIASAASSAHRSRGPPPAP